MKKENYRNFVHSVENFLGVLSNNDLVFILILTQWLMIGVHLPHM